MFFKVLKWLSLLCAVLSIFMWVRSKNNLDLIVVQYDGFSIEAMSWTGACSWSIWEGDSIYQGVDDDFYVKFGDGDDDPGDGMRKSFGDGEDYIPKRWHSGFDMVIGYPFVEDKDKTYSDLRIPYWVITLLFLLPFILPHILRLIRRTILDKKRR